MPQQPRLQPPPLLRLVLVRNRCLRLRAPAAEIRRLVHALDASRHVSAPAGELSIVLLGARSMGRLHARFLGDPAPTDVITFDGDPLLGAAGEICVCAEVARDFAQAHRHDFSTELALYIIHGYLHLAGFNDTSPDTRRAMRRAEARGLADVRAAGGLPQFSFRD